MVSTMCENDLSIMKNLLEQMESKFSHIEQEIKNKKQYINQTMLELHEFSMVNSHYQNVEKLAAGIAHEIRNPLTTVSGFIQLLKPYLKEIGKDQYADIALDELKRANEIIYEFLNASKPSEDNIIPISINKLVKETTLLYESEAILNNIEIVNEFTEKEVKILANPKQIKQVLINLLKNAMEAITENNKQQKGMIYFKSDFEDGQASIMIQDNGCGMSDNIVNKLFLPFHSTKEKGTGVGLTICKKIIEDHSGSIAVESNDGAGTTFRIHLPVYKEEVSR